MVLNHKIYYFIFAIIVALTACNRQPEQQTQSLQTPTKTYDEDLAKANERLLRIENEQIASFIKRYNWSMQESGSGLRYNIFEKKQGKTVAYGSTVSLNYTIQLITGDTIYTSKHEGVKTFTIGQGQEPRGLEEAVLMMRPHEKAQLIVPSHLAYGLIGDGVAIPKRACLVYTIEIINVQHK